MELLLLLPLSPKSNLLSMKSRAAIQSVREKYTDTIHGNAALRQRKKRTERKGLSKAASVVLQLVWFPAVMLLLLMMISSFKNPKSVRTEKGLCCR